MCNFLIKDYSEVTEENAENYDFSKLKEYYLNSTFTFDLIGAIFDGKKSPDYSFYTEDGTTCLLDLS